jgi:hypothetical protein
MQLRRPRCSQRRRHSRVDWPVAVSGQRRQPRSDRDATTPQIELLEAELKAVGDSTSVQIPVGRFGPPAEIAKAIVAWHLPRPAIDLKRLPAR